MIEPSDQELAELPECSSQYIEELEAENEKLKKQLEKSEAQNYCKICGNTLDGYESLIEKERRVK